MSIPSVCKQYVLPKTGSIDNLIITETSVPQPKAGEILLKAHAVSVQFRDLMVINNTYPGGCIPDLVPCSDVAGEIVALGPGVTDFKIGDRVSPNFVDTLHGDVITTDLKASALGAPVHGTLTEYRTYPTHTLVKIPDHLSYEEASTLPCAAVTAYNALMGGFSPLKAGDSILVLGTGSVSTFALQIGVASGASVIVTSSSDEKLQVAKRLGAAHVINYKTTPAWEEEVMRLTNGRGVDQVVEVGGEATLDKSIASVRMGGSVTVMGGLAGAPGQAPVSIIPSALFKSLKLRGIYVGSVEQFKNLGRLMAANPEVTRPLIDKVFPFEQAKEAFKRLSGQAHIGKVVIKMAVEIPSRRHKTKRPEKGIASTDTKSTADASFADGSDFIALGPVSDEDEEDAARDSHSRRDRKGKEREREQFGDEDGGGSRRERREPSTSPPPLPSGSRGSAEGARKYDLVFDPEDRPPPRGRQRTDVTGRLTPWVDDVDWDVCKTPSEMFHREVKAFVKWIAPTPEEDEVRGLVLQLITRCVTRSYADAQVLPFGSYATKLYLPLGDIDLVIRSPSMAYHNPKTVLHSLAATIRNSGLTHKVQVIAKAKVPIIKFVTTGEYGRLNVDISINQENGLVAGEMINSFLREIRGGGAAARNDCLALRALVLMTKLFLSQRGMNEVFTGGLGSYAIVCLVISFLQMHPQIRFGLIDPDENLGVLVMEFFELYGTRFNYDDVGISVREGGAYFSKRQRGWDFRNGQKRNGMLSIEDPGDPFNDISAGSYNFPNVRRHLGGAHEVLTATIYLRAGIVESRKHGRALKLRDRYDAEDLTILGSILGITQETINNRTLIKEVFDGGALHRALGVTSKIVRPPSEPEEEPEEGEVPQKKKSRKKKKSKKPVSTSGLDSAADRSKESSVNGTRTPDENKEIVEQIWAQADQNSDTDIAAPRDVDEGGGQKRGNHVSSEGRYAIVSKKRRRNEGSVVTFTAAASDSASDVGKEDVAPPAKDSTKPPSKRAGMSRVSSSSSVSSATKRDYWLSKGVGPSSPGVSP
ncbi:unnamed protein product [Mycena citricolor]|uniref:polynucleotide adenylyltransferase n=1 Tax=Mycena citricolor TaxID=2018698 RepID=A0AAD2H111_9AGAR|nr:unnamed protein product [Mycena citricolor]